MDFVVLRGDRRQNLLCDLLVADGHRAQLVPEPEKWGMENLPPPGAFLVTAKASAALREAALQYGFTLLDAANLTEITDFFPEKVMNCEESFIITHADSFGRYLIFDGCYWGCDYIYAAYDPATHRFVDLSRAYGILPGDHHARVWGGCLHLLGDTPDRETYEVKIKEADISALMTERGTTDF